MAVLLHARHITKSYSAGPLFRDISLTIEENERIGLIGPNGSGKSTLLKILAALEEPDADTPAELTTRRHLRVAYVAQRDEFPQQATVLQAVVHALREPGHAPPGVHEEHERETHALVVLGRAGFVDMDMRVDSLSGGWRKRLAIVRALAAEPDLLLMDEPTNHLDLHGILWLESMLQEAALATVIVTHDRCFLESFATRVIELSRTYPQGLISVNGPYSEFLRRREELLNAQRREQQALASKVRQDLIWLSRGAQARRTKAKGRIEDASQRKAQLDDLKSRNAAAPIADIDFNASGRQSRKLLVAKGVSKSLGGQQLFADLDLTLSPGMKLGLLGPNGSGKTTLIRVLTGELEPDAGTITQADALRIVVFKQRREDLDLSQTLREALCPIGDTLYYRDRAIHVTTWARKFLFRTEQLHVPVGDLSGGEQARILIARMMLEPADVLVLDEPTNDLDISTLEVLEESLEGFPGALVLVTHDRFMLSRLATEILSLDGCGNAKSFADYLQWERAQQHVEAQPAAAAAKPREARTSAAAAQTSSPPPARKRLTYNEQREWDHIEQNILEAEQCVEQLQHMVNDPAIASDHRKLQEVCNQLAEAQARVAQLYDRWAELEAKQR